MKKRFWTIASVARADGGWAVRLDGRPIKTPAGAPLIAPTEALAQAAAAEWNAVEEGIDPDLMPATRLMNSAIDRVDEKFAEVAEMIAAYGGSDLLCYRAEAPEGLVTRQAQGWDPLLDWADATLGARLTLATGIMPVDQPEPAMAALRAQVFAQNPFALCALHDLVTISGSLILGLAVAHGRLTAPVALGLSRIDEDWQAEAWGQDAEAAAVAQRRERDFLAAARLYRLCVPQ